MRIYYDETVFFKKVPLITCVWVQGLKSIPNLEGIRVWNAKLLAETSNFSRLLNLLFNPTNKAKKFHVRPNSRYAAQIKHFTRHHLVISAVNWISLETTLETGGSENVIWWANLQSPIILVTDTVVNIIDCKSVKLQPPMKSCPSLYHRGLSEPTQPRKQMM